MASHKPGIKFAQMAIAKAKGKGKTCSSSRGMGVGSCNNLPVVGSTLYVDAIQRQDS